MSQREDGLILTSIDLSLPLSFDYVYLVPISDVHFGDPLTDTKTLKKYVEWVERNPNAYVLFLGDILNCATKDSASDIYREELSVFEACELVWDTFRNISNRVLGWTEGNHERRLYTHTKGYIGSHICSKYRWRFFRDYAFLKLRFGARKNGKPLVYTVYAVHGEGPVGVTKGAKINKLQSLNRLLHADIYLMGHLHDSICFREPFYLPDLRNGKVDKIERHFVLTGSFLRYGDYAARRLLPSLAIGSPCVQLNTRRREIVVFDSLEHLLKRNLVPQGIPGESDGES